MVSMFLCVLLLKKLESEKCVEVDGKGVGRSVESNLILKKNKLSFIDKMILNKEKCIGKDKSGVLREKEKKKKYFDQLQLSINQSFSEKVEVDRNNVTINNFEIKKIPVNKSDLEGIKMSGLILQAICVIILVIFLYFGCKFYKKKYAEKANESFEGFLRKGEVI